MQTIPNTYEQTDPDVIRDRALRGFSRAAEARSIRAERACSAQERRDRTRRLLWDDANGIQPSGYLEDLADEIDGGMLHTFCPNTYESSGRYVEPHDARGILADVERRATIWGYSTAPHADETTRRLMDTADGLDLLITRHIRSPRGRTY